MKTHLHFIFYRVPFPHSVISLHLTYIVGPVCMLPQLNAPLSVLTIPDLSGLYLISIPGMEVLCRAGLPVLFSSLFPVHKSVPSTQQILNKWLMNAT